MLWIDTKLHAVASVCGAIVAPSLVYIDIDIFLLDLTAGGLAGWSRSLLVPPVRRQQGQHQHVRQSRHLCLHLGVHHHVRARDRCGESDTWYWTACEGATTFCGKGLCVTIGLGYLLS